MKGKILFCHTILLYVTGCVSATALNQYAGRGFQIYTQASEVRIAPVMEEAQRFLQDAGTYLNLDVPAYGTLSIYLYRWRWDLWRHLGRVCPQWRWRRAACCEQATGYMIGISGSPDRAFFLEDLRHELTHYLLATHFSDLPPWVDEGLAEVMAKGPSFPGPGHGDMEVIRCVLKDASVRDLRALLSVLPGEKLSREQYHLAWAWTYALLTGLPDGKESILRYMETTRSDMDPEGVFAQIWGRSLEEMFLSMDYK